MAIFHCYVSSPEGNLNVGQRPTMANHGQPSFEPHLAAKWSGKLVATSGDFDEVGLDHPPRRLAHG